MIWFAGAAKAGQALKVAICCRREFFSQFRWGLVPDGQGNSGTHLLYILVGLDLKPLKGPARNPQDVGLNSVA